jgi:hypothetical protein
MDHWKLDVSDNILWSIERRIACRHFLSANQYRVADSDQLWALLMTHPVCNEELVYACVMDPATGSLTTRVPSLNLPPKQQQISKQYVL